RGTGEEVRRRVAAYYDTTQVLYSHLWSPNGVHYGLWENGTRGHTEAIRNLDRFVAARLDLAPGSRVLDAGCGVGGTSLYPAERRGIDVTGITLSRDQLRRAERARRASPARALARFEIGDYLATDFADGTFDGVIAIESSCYAEPKRAFLAEAFRVLKPG